VNSGGKFFGKCIKALLLLISGFLLIAAGGEKKEVTLDPKQMLSYVHETHSRPDFPVAVTLLRDYVYSTLALGEQLDARQRDSIVAFVKKTQKSDGGFSIDPPTENTSSLYTDLMIESLAYMSAFNTIDIVKAKAYLASLIRADGGFSFDAKAKDSSLPSTYNTVHALALLNGLDIVDKAKTAAYIKGFQLMDSGGFSYVKGKTEANSKDTYMGVYCLKVLGMLDEETKKGAIQYLTSTSYIGNFKKILVTHNLEEEAYTIMAMKMLGAGTKIKRDKVIAFIKGFYIPDNGGFGSMQGYGSAPDPSYWGFRCLAELGVLKQPVEGRLQ